MERKNVIIIILTPYITKPSSKNIYKKTKPIRSQLDTLNNKNYY